MISNEEVANRIYQKLMNGTPRDKESCDIAIKALEEVQEYRKIGTVEECRKEVEKTKALKPKKKKMKHCYDYHCAKCGKRFISKDDSGWYCGEFEKFCSECGTPVDWSGQRLEGEE